MLLDWLGNRRNDDALREAGRRVQRAVERGLAAGELLGPDLGGTATTTAIGDRVAALLASE